MPTVWFCDNVESIKICDYLKSLFQLFSEILSYFDKFSNEDSYKVTYLYFLWITIRMISGLVPLEVADEILPKEMKFSLCMAAMNAPIYLLYPELHATIQEYVRVITVFCF